MHAHNLHARLIPTTTLTAVHISSAISNVSARTNTTPDIINQSSQTLQLAMAHTNLMALSLMVTMIVAGGRFADAQIENEYLEPHNAARSDVGVEPLAWDATLEEYARSYAEDEAQSGCLPLQHSDGPYGENLYWSSSASASPGDAVAAWVAEREFYDYDSNSCATGEVCGHYTQVVWRDTTHVGCASVQCVDGGTFFICSYNPPGNYVGERPY